jgi:NTP pyrophosphatase (non-canonical NTP hydrolase)
MRALWADPNSVYNRKQRKQPMVADRSKGGDILHDSPIRADLFDGTLNGFQRAAQTTAIYPGKGTFWGLVYVNSKCCGEAGEFSEKIGKLMRDDGLEPTDTSVEIPTDKYHLLIKEIGDELWYIAAKCSELGITLEQAARINIEKLQNRQKRGTLSGSGDNR